MSPRNTLQRPGYMQIFRFFAFNSFVVSFCVFLQQFSTHGAFVMTDIDIVAYKTPRNTKKDSCDYHLILSTSAARSVPTAPPTANLLLLPAAVPPPTAAWPLTCRPTTVSKKENEDGSVCIYKVVKMHWMPYLHDHFRKRAP